MAPTSTRSKAKKSQGSQSKESSQDPDSVPVMKPPPTRARPVRAPLFNLDEIKMTTPEEEQRLAKERVAAMLANIGKGGPSSSTVEFDDDGNLIRRESSRRVARLPSDELNPSWLKDLQKQLAAEKTPTPRQSVIKRTPMEDEEEEEEEDDDLDMNEKAADFVVKSMEKAMGAKEAKKPAEAQEAPMSASREASPAAELTHKMNRSRISSRKSVSFEPETSSKPKKGTKRKFKAQGSPAPIEPRGSFDDSDVEAPRVAIEEAPQESKSASRSTRNSSVAQSDARKMYEEAAASMKAQREERLAQQQEELNATQAELARIKEEDAQAKAEAEAEKKKEKNKIRAEKARQRRLERKRKAAEEEDEEEEDDGEEEDDDDEEYDDDDDEHHGVTKFQCDLCGKYLKNKLKLRRHAKVHNGETEAYCPICKAEIKFKYNLKHHLTKCQETLRDDITDEQVALMYPEFTEALEACRKDPSMELPKLPDGFEMNEFGLVTGYDPKLNFKLQELREAMHDPEEKEVDEFYTYKFSTGPSK